MEFNSKSKITSILLVILIFTCSSGYAQSMSNWPVKVEFEVENVFLIDNSLQFSIGFTPNSPQCDIIEVSIESFDGLTYFGEAYWTIPTDDLTSYIKYIDIMIPSNCTSRIEISVNCDNRNNTIIRKFISTTDTLEIIKGLYSSNQFGMVEPQYDENVEFIISNENDEIDTLNLEAESDYHGTIIKDTIYDGPLSKFMTIEERKNYDRLSPLELELIYMRSVEVEPLKDKEREYYFIKELLFMRKKGQHKFVQINGLKEEKVYYQNLIDSLLNTPLEGEYDVTIILSSSNDYDFVSSLVDVLVPTSRRKLFRAIINNKIAKKIKTKKIKFKKSKLPVHQKRKKE